MSEEWEEEILSRHRWGRPFFWFKTDKERATEEHAHLKKLWESAKPLDESLKAVMDQILALEICNWNLEESIEVLCAAIGAKKPARQGIGHVLSMTEERWKRIWSYYLTLRNWLPCEGRSGYDVLLRMCDFDRTIQNHIERLLGDRIELKELYVERLCLCLEFWLGGLFEQESAQMKAHENAVLAVEKEIKKHDPEGQILISMEFDGDGKLNPCHHKAFRRYDIIISSIGTGTWRAVMPMKGSDGFERADTLEKYLSPIESWIHGRRKEGEEEGELFDRIHASLSEQNDAKLFLASLLVSLLRSQQLAARKLTEKRKQKS